MKNQHIHKGLDKSEIRDFLGKRIFKGLSVHSPQYIKKQIKELQEELILAQQEEAIITITKLIGWNGFDISDEIEDYSTDTYMNFVGTEEEYQDLINKIKEKKE